LVIDYGSQVRPLYPIPKFYSINEEQLSSNGSIEAEIKG